MNLRGISYSQRIAVAILQLFGRADEPFVWDNAVVLALTQASNPEHPPLCIVSLEIYANGAGNLRMLDSSGMKRDT